MATVDGMAKGSGRVAARPRINNSAEEWLHEVLRRAGAPGGVDESLAELFPSTGRRGRPYRPDPVRLYLAWRSMRLLERLTDEQIAVVLCNRYGIQVSNLERARSELRRFAARLADAPWTALRVPQPLDDIMPAVDRSARNVRINSLRAGHKAAEVIHGRLRKLCKPRMQPPLMSSHARMEELERRALLDFAVMNAAATYEATTGNSGRDLITACVAAYESATFPTFPCWR